MLITRKGSIYYHMVCNSFSVYSVYYLANLGCETYYEFIVPVMLLSDSFLNRYNDSHVPVGTPYFKCYYI